MDFSKYKIYLAIGVGAIISFVGFMHFHDQALTKEINNEWELKIANTPVHSIDTIFLPQQKIPEPAETLSTKADVDTTQWQHTTPDDKDSLVTPEFRAQIDSLNGVIFELSKIAKGTLNDSLGGLHILKYSPTERVFSEVFLPSPRLINGMEIDKTKLIGYDERHGFLCGFGGVWHFEPGVSFAVGYKPLLLSVAVFNELAPSYSITTLFEF